MKYLGNYKEWIQSDWINYMIENEGHKHPRIDPNEYGVDNNLDKIKSYGYDLNSIFWYSFERDNFAFDINLPIDLGENIDWWFVKMLPSNFIPMHKDHNPKKYSNMTCRRFWMPLQDYVEGHVFINGGEFLKEYRAGDVFEYSQHEQHGAFNISKGSVRLTFNFAVYENV